jgi:hypothetical protein
MFGTVVSGPAAGLKGFLPYTSMNELRFRWSDRLGAAVVEAVAVLNVSILYVSTNEA